MIHNKKQFNRYNLQSFDPPTEVEADILESAKAIDDLIDAEIERGTPPDRIILGGFSQGAAMTLLTGLTTEHPIAGLIVLSGRLPLRDTFKAVGSTPLITQLVTYHFSNSNLAFRSMFRIIPYSGDMVPMIKL